MDSAARKSNESELTAINKDYRQGETNINDAFTGQYFGARLDNVNTLGDAEVAHILAGGQTNDKLLESKAGALGDYYNATSESTNNQLAAKLDAITNAGRALVDNNDQYLGNMGGIYDARIGGTSGTGNWMQTAGPILELGGSLAGMMPRTFNATSALRQVNSLPKFNTFTPSSVMTAPVPAVTQAVPQFRI
jgi:hypothetical protein